MFSRNLIVGLHFFFKHGRFPGSQKLVMLPQIKTPSFMRTEMSLSPIDLFKKFAGTDAKELVSDLGSTKYSFRW